MKNVIGKWRDSATLIILGKRNSESILKSGDCNYDVLVQTRPRSASYPNSIVFPGGVYEAADASGDWLKLLKHFGYSDQDFNALYKNTRPITPIFQNNPVLRNVALRITAIRETFEEVGLLICSKEPNKDRKSNWANICTNIDVEYWQDRVSKDPSQFLSLCEQNSCYPDIWSLHSWSNWLTPARKPHRFDAAFFITALNEQPGDLKSSNEVVNIQWSTPLELLDQNLHKKVELYPPQWYELTYLSHLKNAQDLKSFSEDRLNLCDELMYPIDIKAKDGTLFLLPGDDLYPSDVNYNDQPIVIDKTILELSKEGNSQHRFEEKNTKKVFITKNRNSTVMGNKNIKLHSDLN